MGQINWITPVGSLGTIAENEYFEFQFDAYDTAANISEPIVYSIVSGMLAPGLELSPTGQLYGIPTILLNNLVSQSFNQEFAIRAKVTHSSGSYLTDRTFSLTINPIAIPQIYPTNITLGYYQDGKVIDIPLLATDFDPLAPLTWEVVSGELPLGTILTPAGRLYGYILPTISTSGENLVGWDTLSWDQNPWDLLNTLTSVNTYTFTVQVSDGSRIDKTTYSIDVTTTSSVTSDNDTTTIDVNSIDIDSAGLHNPQIITVPQYLPVQRQYTNFNFQVIGNDLDNSALTYLIGPPTNFQISATEPPHARFIGSSVGTTLTVSSLTGSIVIGSQIDYQSGTILPYTTILTQLSGNVNGEGTYLLSEKQTISSEVMTIGPQGGDQWWDTINNQILTYSQVTIPLSTPDIAAGLTYSITSLGSAYETLYFNRGLLITPNTVVPLSGEYSFSLGIDGSLPVTYNISLNSDTISNIAVKMQNALLSNIASVHTSFNTISIVSTSTGDSSIVNLVIPSLTGNDLIGNINSTLSSTTTLTSTLSTDFTQIGATSNTVGQTFVATKRKDTLAGQFIIGQSYVISYVGNTDFTLIGATSNANGGLFVATGTGTLGESGRALQDSGSGTVTLTNKAWEVLIPYTDLSNVNVAEQILLETPVGINISPTSGWVTGNLSVDPINGIQPIPFQEQTYVFQVQAEKTSKTTVRSDPVTLVMTILGSEVDTITWITPSIVGIINEGTISDLSLQAVSSMGYQLVYEQLSGVLPAGLTLQTDGLIVGQVPFTPSHIASPLTNVPLTFDISSTSPGATTFDSQTTSFDSNYVIEVKVRNTANTISNTKIFTIKVSTFNIVPYENLYLKALLPRNLRTEFLAIMNNKEIFPDNLIYRIDDPWFGKSIDIKFLFAAGLNVEGVATYLAHMQNNHYNKVVNLGNVKTAIAVDSNFKPKYEVVYVEVTDSTTSNGKSPPLSINTGLPAPNNVVYPNSFVNMKTEIISGIGYANQGAIPEWMLATQPNGTVLGFTYGVILAYTVPGASNLIAYRLLQSGITFNDIDFVVDRYQLNAATGLGKLPEVGDLYIKFPKTNSFGT